LVETTDGRLFVLAGSAGFSLGTLSRSEVVVRRGEETLAIPLSEVNLIRFPRAE
jgi:hypothetical protein